MAPAADPSSNHHSPRGPEFSGDGVDSPHLRRRNLPSPWAQVVRGEPESIHGGGHQSPPSSLSSVGPTVSEQIPFSDCSPSKAGPPPSLPPPLTMDNSAAAENSNGSNSIVPQKHVWNKLSNGVVEAGSVMDDQSWPALSALSESTKASPRQSAADSSPKPVTHGSVSNAQGLVKTHSPRKQTNTNANANANANPNHTLPTRQRSMKRGGGGGDRSFRGPRPAAGFVSQSHPVNDHRNFPRRGNFGSHPHGDGAYHGNYGSRRDQDRGNFANARDPHMQPQRAPPFRGFVRSAAPSAPPFMARPFGNPMGFQDIVYMPTLPYEPIRPVPYIGHPPPPPPPPAMFFPVAEPSLPTLLVNQIDYYFSEANLVKDDFLRSNMDEQGWVPISLIAGFPRVKNLTTNIQLILTSLNASSVVEVQDDKVRKRNEWGRWLPTAGRVSTESGTLSQGSSSNNLLATSFQNITLEEATVDQNTIAGKADPDPEHSPEKSNNLLATSFQNMTLEEATMDQNTIAAKADPDPEHAPEKSKTESTSQSQVANGEVTQNTHSS
ncbi:Transcriptional repressor poly-beta-hydroxybutyrate-responsive [Trema orientale]|uniref:Transcriptional repressor poly-beta-hydroxybutyrate-responsive n=1 Tax=Trema orientale TaxID=63057 RepID=A0A2P5F823_TREOI|nr:Transcriptional repressor poly-beta-hydroxybutyrate-responsive [Trema orientale]